MTVLLLGASGFIGSAIAEALLADGHQVRATARDLAYARRILPAAEWVQVDLRHTADWASLLSDVSIVINASGALQSGLRDNVGRVQEEAIIALVNAASAAGIAQFIQISAAGADTQASDFMATKARADAAVAGSGMPHTIIRPGLVIGRNGFGGTELIRSAAGLPLALEIGGTGMIQCAALADVVAAARRAIAEPQVCHGKFDLVEAGAHSLGTVIAQHRQWLGLPPARLRLAVPVALLRPLSLLADALGWLGWRSPLRSNAVAALVHGVKGDAAESARLLGREPLSLKQTLAGLGLAGKADRWHARIAAIYPLALAGLVFLWLAGGLIGLARLDEAAALLVTGGTPAEMAKLVVVGGSLADLALAFGIIYRPTLRIALAGGAVLAAGYALGAGIVRPDLWLDPLGAMVKVVPIIALSLMCHGMAEER